MSYHNDHDFQSELATDARLDALSELEQLAQERGFESVEDMQDAEQVAWDDFIDQRRAGA